MSKGIRFTDEFKQDAVVQVVERGYAVSDLGDAGETCSENRVARLASLAGIAAQIGYKRRPGRYGGTPAVVADNTLDRQIEVDMPERV
jgi:transposase-like protein